MAGHHQPEIDTHVLAQDLRELNLKRTPGEWRLHANRYIVEPDRLTPTLAQTGGIRAKANCAFLFFLASNAETIIERLERLARLEKMIEEELGSSSTILEKLSVEPPKKKSRNQRGEFVAAVEAIFTPTDSQKDVRLAQPVPPRGA